MKLSQKNWLLPNNINPKKSIKQLILLGGFFFLFFFSSAQITNYINNGGFEDCVNCNQTSFATVARYWNATDTGKFGGIVLTSDPPTGLVPKSSYTYQWPRHGKNFLVGTEFNATCPAQSCVGYPRNRLKSYLQVGKQYCFTMYVTLSNESTHAINSLGVYFGDSTTDTITICTKPITYLTPQIVNISGFISDTLNWVKISGTYTANGTEKYIMLGNYNSSASTNTIFVNPTHSPAAFSVYCYDDISLIDIDLPAFAGRDTFFIPGDSVYLGRPSDVGIDEACMWYKLPNTTTAIDTVAGLWVKPVTTTTYVVKQEICGVIKWDTVVLYQSAIGVHELDIISNNLKIYPQPVTNEVNIQLNLQMDAPFNKYQLYNNLGQLIREEELSFKNHIASIRVEDLANGVYFISISNLQNETITKKLVIAR